MEMFFKMNVNSTNRESRFYSVREYAQHLGRCERTVRKWIYDGRFPVIQIGEGAILIDPVAADAALARKYERKAVIKGK
jgi:predicted site-specific integrase-resolvase